MKLHTFILFFFSSRRRHTRSLRDWSSDVCSSDLFWEYSFSCCLCFLLTRGSGFLRFNGVERLILVASKLGRHMASKFQGRAGQGFGYPVPEVVDGFRVMPGHLGKVVRGVPGGGGGDPQHEFLYERNLILCPHTSTTCGCGMDSSRDSHRCRQ